jgi:hypothetical protein
MPEQPVSERRNRLNLKRVRCCTNCRFFVGSPVMMDQGWCIDPRIPQSTRCYIMADEYCDFYESDDGVM